MKLAPLTKQMRLFARRVINLGNRRIYPGEELITTPKGPGALSWRRIAILYSQRRVISEADPYFEELMREAGLENNPQFARKWLGLETKEESEEPEDLEDPQIPQGPIVEVKGANGWYDVIVDGETVNEKRLRRDEADSLAKEYIDGTR